jgi:hypothetical protein
VGVLCKIDEASMFMELLPAMKAVVESSATMVTWALAVVAASVATIVSTSYLHPSNNKVRRVYLLFLPGWLLLGLSVYFGDRVSRRYIAARFVEESMRRPIAEGMNGDFSRQQTMLMLGLGVFALWLVAFLIWWVFGDWTTTSSKEAT